MPEPLGLDAEEVRTRLDELDYLVDEGMATALFLALALGHAAAARGRAGRRQDGRGQGAGRALDDPLIRLQCYEGLTAARRCTSGTTSASCWRSGWPSRGARR